MGTTLLKSKKTKSLVIILLSIVLLFSLTVSSVSASILGDVNDDGRIDVQDATLVMRHALGIALLSSSQQESADVNGDGIVNVQDTTLILQKTLAIIDVFPDPKGIDTALEMTVHFIDVGQGDSILIETSEKNILSSLSESKQE